ncbi:MAG: PKD domain-containing protein [Candidatus Methanospirareceae archaeon]
MEHLNNKKTRLCYRRGRWEKKTKQKAAESSGKPIEQQFEVMGTKLKIQEINFTDLSPGRYKLLVKIYGNTMDFGWMTCTEVKCHWMNGECDTTDCPGDYNRTLICGPTGCTGNCDGQPPGTIRCKYDDSCVGSLTASIVSPKDGDIFFAGIDPVPFEGSASGGSKPYTYSWDLGNGITKTGQLFTYTYPSTDTGSRTVTLTVTDSASNTATDSVTIHIHSPAVLFSCAIKTSCGGGETEVLGLSAQDNAHAELPTEENYTYKLCCANVSSVQTTTGTGTCDTLGAGFTGLITLSGDTNAQVEKYNYTGTDGFLYKKNVCVKLVGGGEF